GRAPWLDPLTILTRPRICVVVGDRSGMTNWIYENLNANFSMRGWAIPLARRGPTTANVNA
ncbi:MAG: hypothetical protein JWO10_864, partial [Microbacteriaceae bacterium]|nr:hypothetical protein [Microbacteriaceae bacterium]